MLTKRDDRLPVVTLCRNCKQPAGERNLESGRCNACARYYERTGEERPKKLSGRFLKLTTDEKAALLLKCREAASLEASNGDMRAVEFWTRLYHKLNGLST